MSFLSNVKSFIELPLSEQYQIIKTVVFEPLFPYIIPLLPVIVYLFLLLVLFFMLPDIDNPLIVTLIISPIIFFSVFMTQFLRNAILCEDIPGARCFTKERMINLLYQTLFLFNASSLLSSMITLCSKGQFSNDKWLVGILWCFSYTVLYCCHDQQYTFAKEQSCITTLDSNNITFFLHATWTGLLAIGISMIFSIEQYFELDMHTLYHKIFEVFGLSSLGNSTATPTEMSSEIPIESTIKTE